MIHIPSFTKLSWNKIFCDPSNTSAWKLLLLDTLEIYGHLNILQLGSPQQINFIYVSVVVVRSVFIFMYLVRQVFKKNAS